ncbi:HlyIII-domain-containing protein [Lophium mytilinum]|uniref:HlyIII-domain-containing protein n=1 Tax=Lophium mytilinum TaxID=390894 RepID=A0A6A6RG75_9PEZI|nr:HlyIII-domain-containing protein [Lophium mytilinum]
MASITVTLRRPITLLRLASRTSDEPPKLQAHPLDPDIPVRLLSFNDLPPWYQDNPYIRTAYRPVSNSFAHCLHSLSYFHNETLNIYTHLLPAILLLLSFTPYPQSLLRAHLPTSTPLDRAIFTLNLLAALTTFSLSATYHTCMSHSHSINAAALLADYAGILLLILASFISGIHVGFYCEPALKLLYWSMISILTSLTAVLVLHPRLQGPRCRSVRTTAFVATALSGFAPIAHGLWLYGWADMWGKSGMRWWLGEGVAYGIGAGFFAGRWPERWVWERWGGGKGRWVDVLGGSHQIFHCLVVVGAVVHLGGVWEAWDWVGRGEGLGGCVAG